MTDTASKLFDMNRTEDLLFHLLRTFYQFERIEVSKFNLSFDLIYILKFLRRKDTMRISDIAEEMKIKVFTATRLIDQLENRDYIRRKRDKSDKRNILVSITAKGKSIAGKIESHAIGLIIDNIDKIKTEDLESMVRIAKLFNEILNIEPSKYLDPLI